MRPGARGQETRGITAVSATTLLQKSANIESSSSGPEHSSSQGLEDSDIAQPLLKAGPLCSCRGRCLEERASPCPSSGCQVRRERGKPDPTLL